MSKNQEALVKKVSICAISPNSKPQGDDWILVNQNWDAIDDKGTNNFYIFLV